MSRTLRSSFSFAVAAAVVTPMLLCSPASAQTVDPDLKEAKASALYELRSEKDDLQRLSASDALSFDGRNPWSGDSVDAEVLFDVSIEPGIASYNKWLEKVKTAESRNQVVKVLRQARKADWVAAAEFREEQTSYFLNLEKDAAVPTVNNRYELAYKTLEDLFAGLETAEDQQFKDLCEAELADIYQEMQMRRAEDLEDTLAQFADVPVTDQPGLAQKVLLPYHVITVFVQNLEEQDKLNNFFDSVTSYTNHRHEENASVAQPPAIP